MARFQSHDLCLAYDDIAPAGEVSGTVVLVHGFATNRAENWRRLGWLGAFERQGRRAVALDLRGHGESDKPHDPSAYGSEQMAQDITNLMDHLEIGRADLMGYSLGAHLAMSAALLAPGRVDRLILGGVGARMINREPPPPGAMTMAQALTIEDAGLIADATQRGFRRFAEAQGEDLQALAACSQARGAPMSIEDIRRLSAPTLIVAGTQDEIAGDPAILAAEIPGAKAVSLPACDHFSAIPHALFKAAVFDFLDGWEEFD